MNLFSMIINEQQLKLSFEEARNLFNTSEHLMNNDEELFTEIKRKVRKLVDLKELSLNQQKELFERS